MMKKITEWLNSILSKNFKLWSLILLAGLPLFFSFFFLFFQWQKTKELEEKTFHLIKKTKKSFKIRSLKFAILQKYSNINPYYLHHYLEPLVFCENELNLLNRLSYHPAFAKNVKIKKRIDLLKTGNNMKFVEEITRNNSFIKEREEHLCSPIQVNSHDLKKILCLIEGRQIDTQIPPKNKPQILIKKFSLKKHTILSSNEIFSLEMDLITREFIQ